MRHSFFDLKLVTSQEYVWDERREDIFYDEWAPCTQRRIDYVMIAPKERP